MYVTCVYVQCRFWHFPHLKRSVGVPAVTAIWASLIASLVNFFRSVFISSFAISLKKRCIVKKYRPFSLNEWSDFETAVSLVISKSLVQVYIEDFRKLNTYFSRHFRHPFRSYFTTQNSFSQLFIFGIAKIWNSTSNSCLILCICVLKFFIYTWIILVKETYFILHVRM